MLSITHLVYIAIEGIERAQSGRFQRPDAYLHHRAEGFRFFWLSVAGFAAVLSGGIAWLLAIRSRRSQLSRWVLAIVGGIALGLSTIYAHWYFSVGYPTMAPDFATAGFQSGVYHWWSAALLLMIVIPFVAYRIADESSSLTEIERLTSVTFVPFPLGRGMLTFAAISGMCCSIAFLFYVRFYSWGSGFLDWFKYLLTEVNLFLPSAIILIVWQTSWKVWRNPEATAKVEIPSINPQRFVLACIGLVVFVPVAVATITAFSFSAWFNPWIL